MPNYCQNTINIVCKSEQVDEIINSLKRDNTPLSFDNIIPMPKELEITSPAHTDEEKAIAKKNEEKYGFRDWYGWRISNWGAKWDVGDDVSVSIDCQGNYTVVVYKFDTPWSPVIPIAMKISEMHPNTIVIIAFDEPGMDFSGKSVFFNGMLVEEENMKSISNLTLDLAGDVDAHVYMYIYGLEER